MQAGRLVSLLSLYLFKQIVDVKFDKEPEATVTRTKTTDPTTTGLPITAEKPSYTLSSTQPDGADVDTFLTGDLFDVEGDACLPTIFEDQAAPCSNQPKQCVDSGKPKCQAFPYQQANPADLIPQETCVSDASENLFDTDELMPDYARSNSDASCDTGSASGAWSAEASASSATSTSSISTKPAYSQREATSLDDGLTYLDSLDFLLGASSKSNVTGAPDLNTAPNDQSSPSIEPSRMKLGEQIKTLAKQAESAASSNNGSAGFSAGALKDLRLSDGYRSRGLRLVHQPLSARPLGCTKLVKRRQLELWRNFSENIASWLDVSGSKRHFQYTLPLLAKASDYLHYAVLAVSSRHLELRESGQPGAESAGLYADAVQLLLPVIQTVDTPVVSTCLLLCVTEMMHSPPHLCQHSLRSCATMLELADFNARSTGFQQAIFWSFANLTALGGLASPHSPVLSMRLFYPSDSNSLATATSYIRSQTWGEGYAKYAVFLTAAIIEVVASHSMGRDGQQGTLEATRWKVLSELLEDWHNCRPEEMQALMSYPSILDDYRHPFPMVLYGSAAAVTGNILYHAASILLLQQKPAMIELPKNHKSLSWHARQVCGIVAENHDKGSWPSVLRPLWIAGKVISNVLERERIVEMLNAAQKESGWATGWYLEDLQMHWTTG